MAHRATEREYARLREPSPGQQPRHRASAPLRYSDFRPYCAWQHQNALSPNRHDSVTLRERLNESQQADGASRLAPTGATLVFYNYCLTNCRLLSSSHYRRSWYRVHLKRVPPAPHVDFEHLSAWVTDFGPCCKNSRWGGTGFPPVSFHDFANKPFGSRADQPRSPQAWRL